MRFSFIKKSVHVFFKCHLYFYAESTHRKPCMFQGWLDECSSHDGLYRGSTRILLTDTVVTNGRLVRNYNFLAVCRAGWEKNVCHGAFSPWSGRREALDLNPASSAGAHLISRKHFGCFFFCIIILFSILGDKLPASESGSCPVCFPARSWNSKNNRPRGDGKHSMKLLKRWTDSFHHVRADASPQLPPLRQRQWVRAVVGPRRPWLGAGPGERPETLRPAAAAQEAVDILRGGHPHSAVHVQRGGFSPNRWENQRTELRISVFGRQYVSLKVKRKHIVCLLLPRLTFFFFFLIVTLFICKVFGSFVNLSWLIIKLKFDVTGIALSQSKARIHFWPTWRS